MCVCVCVCLQVRPSVRLLPAVTPGLHPKLAKVRSPVVIRGRYHKGTPPLRADNGAPGAFRHPATQSPASQSHPPTHHTAHGTH